jgi:hypothetical protein
VRVGAAGTNGAPGATASTPTDDRTAALVATTASALSSAPAGPPAGACDIRNSPRPPPSRPIAAEGGSAEGGSAEGGSTIVMVNGVASELRVEDGERRWVDSPTLRARGAPPAVMESPSALEARGHVVAHLDEYHAADVEADRERRASRDRESALQREVEALKERVSGMEAAAARAEADAARAARAAAKNESLAEMGVTVVRSTQRSAGNSQIRGGAALLARMAARRGDGEGGLGPAEDPNAPSARPVAGVEDGPRRGGGADSPRAAKAVAEGREAVDGAESPQPA